MSAQAGPDLMWRIARAAVAAGWYVRVEPRGSSCTLTVVRSGVEVVARWRRGDRDVQGDAAGRWLPEGRASVTVRGDHTWMRLGEVAEWIAQGRDR